MAEFLDIAAVNGALTPTAEATVPATDDGLLRGDGVFETIRVDRGRAHERDEHLARLVRSAAALRLPLDEAQVAADIELLLGALGEVSCLLQALVTRGGNRLVLARPQPEDRPQISLAVVPHAITPILGGVKSLSYAANMLATRLAVERGFDEALLVDMEGFVLECPRSAIFWVEGGAVFGPPTGDGTVESITRRQVSSLVPVESRAIKAAGLAAAAEVFQADTAYGITAVSEVEGAGSFEAPGPVTAELKAAVRS